MAGSADVDLPVDPRTWSEEDVQRWFETYKEGKWAEDKDKFSKLNGERLAMLTKEQFVTLAGPIGVAIYNDVQKLLEQGTALSPLCSRCFFSFSVQTLSCVRHLLYCITSCATLYRASILAHFCCECT